MKKLVTGRAAFVDDLHPAGLLHLALATSPHAHARVTAVDTAAARALPGVVDVITPFDAAWPGPEAEGPRPTTVLTDELRYVGAPVAVAVAEDPELAARAAEALRASYEPRPVVTFDPDAPPTTTCLDRGDVDQASAQAEHLVSVTQGLARTSALPLDPPVALVWLDEDGRLVVRSATASPLRLRRALADALGVAGGRIRIERPEVGGDFGARHGTFLEAACALAALRSGRPARLALRPDHPAGSVGRAGCQVGVRLALRGGALHAIDVRVRDDVGASTAADGEQEAEWRRAADLVLGYDVPAARLTASAGVTNAPPAAGAAALAVCVALEAAMDEAAEVLHEDPLAFRRRHLAKAARDGGLGACLDRVAREAGLPRRFEAQGAPGRRGVGVAVAHATLGGPDAVATVTRNEDASFTVAWSPCEDSTAASPLLEASLARTLGVEPESVAANLAAPAEPPAGGVADLWLTAQAIAAAGAEMAGRGPGAPPKGAGTARATARASSAPAALGAFAAEVDVDAQTGVVTLLRLVLAAGGGSAEPLLRAKAEGQALRGAGAVLLGAAAGLEPRRLRAPDLPRLATFLGLVARPAVFGSAPLGDVVFLGAAAAVANAVARALGTRTRSLPIHPERVLDALEERTA